VQEEIRHLEGRIAKSDESLRRLREDKERHEVCAPPWASPHCSYPCGRRAPGLLGWRGGEDARVRLGENALCTCATLRHQADIARLEEDLATVEQAAKDFEEEIAKGATRGPKRLSPDDIRRYTALSAPPCLGRPAAALA